MFLPSDYEATKVPRKRQAVSKGLSEEEETLKLELSSLKREMAAMLQAMNAANVPRGYVSEQVGSFNYGRPEFGRPCRNTEGIYLG